MCLKQNIGHEQEAKLPARHVMPPLIHPLLFGVLHWESPWGSTRQRLVWRKKHIGNVYIWVIERRFLEIIVFLIAYIYISQSIFPIPLQCNRLASQEASKLQEMVIQKDRSQSWPWKPWKLGNPGNSMGKTSWWMDGENILASYSAVYAGVRVSPSLCG